VNIILLCVLLVLIVGPALLASRRNKSYVWLPEYLAGAAKRSLTSLPKSEPAHVIFVSVDHFEPKSEKVSRAVADERITMWAEGYPKLADSFRDADGKPPQYTWFYPYHEFEREHLQALNALCYRGYGEVEMHIHHGDRARTPEALEAMIHRCLDVYGRQGVLRTIGQTPQTTYGFIHGMWALDNSDERYCGVTGELELLQRTGCYADFGLPAPGALQGRKVNCIYYADRGRGRPKAYHDGVEVRVGAKPRETLMMVQGPITIDWRKLKTRLYPTIDMGEVSDRFIPDAERVDLWVDSRVQVGGRNNWLFVKAFAHGALEPSANVLLGRPGHNMHLHLQSKYNDGERFILHYATAREAYNMIKAAEAGKSGSPHEYRDYVIQPYANTRISTDVLYRLNRLTASELDLEVLERRPSSFLLKGNAIRELRGTFRKLDADLRMAGGRGRIAITGGDRCDLIIALPAKLSSVSGGQLVDCRREGALYVHSISALLDDAETRELTLVSQPGTDRARETATSFLRAAG